jgi:hypothetical protein
MTSHNTRDRSGYRAGNRLPNWPYGGYQVGLVVDIVSGSLSRRARGGHRAGSRLPNWLCDGYRVGLAVDIVLAIVYQTCLVAESVRLAVGIASTGSTVKFMSVE